MSGSTVAWDAAQRTSSAASQPAQARHPSHERKSTNAALTANTPEARGDKGSEHGLALSVRLLFVF